MRLIWILQHAVAVATVLVVAISPATSADVEVEFTRDIRPIFSEHCVECHGGVKQVADLSFVYREQTLSVIEPGDPDDSHIIERVESEDVEQRMPPPNMAVVLRGTKLSYCGNGSVRAQSGRDIGLSNPREGALLQRQNDTIGAVNPSTTSYLPGSRTMGYSHRPMHRQTVGCVASRST